MNISEVTAPAPSILKINWKKIAFTLASIATTIGIFYYLLKYVSWSDVKEILWGIDRNALLVFLLLSLFGNVFRTWRYKVLLNHSGYYPRPLALFLVTLVRNFFSDLLPARVGTLIYVFLVTTRLGVPLAVATSSYALVFLFDIFTMAPLICIVALFVGTSTQLSTSALICGSLVLATITFGMILLLPTLCRLGVSILSKVTFLGASFSNEASTTIANIEKEILEARRAGLYYKVFSLSIFIRLFKYASLYIILYALLAPLGFTIAQLHPLRASLGVLASELSASLPISGIGGFGVYEGTWALTFELLGFSAKIAALTAISHHLFTQVYGLIMGALGFGLLLLPFFREYTSKQARSTARLFYPKMLALFVLFSFISWVCFITPLKESEAHTASADLATSTELAAQQKLATYFPGLILFDSNRSGSFGIYTMKADGSELNAVIDTELQEMYPDPSPDGRSITYTSAMSTNRLAPGEIWISGRDGSNKRMLAEDGKFSTYSSDGKSIYFEKSSKKIVQIDLSSGKETVLFPLKGSPFKGYRIFKPRISSDGKFAAFTSDRPSAWHAYTVELATGETVRIGAGCEPGWFGESSDRLFWIHKSGSPGGSGIYDFSINQSKATVLHDLDHPRGHEYFPSLASKNRFLLYSSCRKGEHSHEDSNYQIFVKDLENEELTRVNFDQLNNRWPKLLSPLN